MLKITLFLMLSVISLADKYIVPELTKGENKELIITLKPRYKHYIVGQGDTLESVAEKFMMSIEELKRRNRLEEGKELKIGMIILVDEVDNK